MTGVLGMTVPWSRPLVNRSGPGLIGGEGVADKLGMTDIEICHLLRHGGGMTTNTTRTNTPRPLGTTGPRVFPLGRPEWDQRPIVRGGGHGYAPTGQRVVFEAHRQGEGGVGPRPKAHCARRRTRLRSNGPAGRLPGPPGTGREGFGL